MSQFIRQGCLALLSAFSMAAGCWMLDHGFVYFILWPIGMSLFAVAAMGAGQNQ